MRIRQEASLRNKRTTIMRGTAAFLFLANAVKIAGEKCKHVYPNKFGGHISEQLAVLVPDIIAAMQKIILDPSSTTAERLSAGDIIGRINSAVVRRVVSERIKENSEKNLAFRKSKLKSVEHRHKAAKKTSIDRKLKETAKELGLSISGLPKRETS